MRREPYPSIENYILASLPQDEYERLLPHLEPVALRQSQILHGAGEPIKNVYFLRGALASFVSRTPEGQSVDVGMVGYEGVTGLSAALGADDSMHDVVVQLPGGGTRLRVGELRAELRRCGDLQRLISRYARGLLLQASQVAACNRLHTISERLARWLLMSQDRCLRADLPLTQEYIAMMLGVRRAGVSDAAAILQIEGYIHHRRGYIRILDRAGLENYACDCYRVVKEEFDLLTARDSERAA